MALEARDWRAAEGMMEGGQEKPTARREGVSSRSLRDARFSLLISESLWQVADQFIRLLQAMRKGPPSALRPKSCAIGLVLQQVMR